MGRALAFFLIAPLLAAGTGNCVAAQPVEPSEIAPSVRTLSAAATATVASAPTGKTVQSPWKASIESVPLPVLHGSGELPELLFDRGQSAKSLRSSCESNAAAVCYDLADRRVQYRGARRYMPEMEGLRAESVSLRHHVVVLKWSFR